MTTTAYKLFNLRKDGSIGPLFINRKQRLEVGVWYGAEDHPTKGYAHRPGWHATTEKKAPHLSSKGRVWARVKLDQTREIERPKTQGGIWLLAGWLKVLEIYYDGFD